MVRQAAPYTVSINWCKNSEFTLEESLSRIYLGDETAASNSSFRPGAINRLPRYTLIKTWVKREKSEHKENEWSTIVYIALARRLRTGALEQSCHAYQTDLRLESA
jgi:hypothetical protein